MKLIEVMPSYTQDIIQPFTPALVVDLEVLAPSVLASIIVKNPILIPNDSKSDSKFCKTCMLIHHLMNSFNCSDADQYLHDLLQDGILTNQICKSLSSQLSQLTEHFIQQDMLTDNFFKLFIYLIKNIPESILFIDVPFSSIPFSNSYLLSFESSFEDKDVFGSFRFYKFAYLAIKSFYESPSFNTLVPLHRLSLSGCIGIDSLLFGFCQFPDLIKTFLKNSNLQTQVLFASIITCLMTSVELPLLKVFVFSNREILIQFFSMLIIKVRNQKLRNSFQQALNLLLCHGTSALAHVYSHWFGYKIMSLKQLYSISPIDPAFAALLLECADDIAGSPQVACEMTKKVLFSQSLATKNALNIISAKVPLLDMMKFANEARQTTLFIPAVNLICNNIMKIDINDNQQQSLFINILLFTLQSEAYLSLLHLEYLSKIFDKIPLDKKVEIFKSISENPRAVTRFILMTTYSSEFINHFASNTMFSKLIISKVKNLIENINDRNKLSLLCIVWHNICLSACQNPTKLEQADVMNIIKEPAQAMVPVFDTDSLITEAFSDCIFDDKIRLIITEPFKVNKTASQGFIQSLWEVDRQLALQLFPELEINEFEFYKSDNNQPMPWGSQRWAKIGVSGQAYVSRS